MTLAWRIDRATRPKAEAFSGKGAASVGGRWNLPGTRVVYAAETLALAALERFVHMGDEGRSVRLVCYRIRVPARVRIEEVRVAGLPRDWRDVPSPRSTSGLGTRWAAHGRTAVLKVPSVLIETEHNYLLNPLHPDFRRIEVSPPRRFRFDRRMW